MIYVIESNGAPLAKGSNAYAYTSRRAAESSARALGARVVEYSVSGTGDDAEKLARDVQSLALELAEAHRIGSNIEDTVRRHIRADEGIAAGLARLSADSARLARVARAVARALDEDVTP